MFLSTLKLGSAIALLGIALVGSVAVANAGESVRKAILPAGPRTLTCGISRVAHHCSIR